MEMEDWAAISLVAAVGLVAICLIIGLCAAGLGGALRLFVVASEQGFVGVAAYIALWAFLFPVMLVISIILGLLLMYIAWDDYRYDRKSDKRTPAAPPSPMGTLSR